MGQPIKGMSRRWIALLCVTDRHPIERPWKLKKGAKYLNSGLLQTLLKQAGLERSAGNFGLKLKSSLVLSVAPLSFQDDLRSHLKMLRMLGGLDVPFYRPHFQSLYDIKYGLSS